MTLETAVQEFAGYSELQQLAYNIAALQQEKSIRSLAVLSFLPGEGKTLFCAALAKAYADACHTKVLVMDTTSVHDPDSLLLKDCLTTSNSGVDLASLQDRQNGSFATKKTSSEIHEPETPALVAQVVNRGSVTVPNGQEGPMSIVKRATGEGAKNYGLVLLDTAPLTAKNRSPIDPLLVARLCDASVLVVSQKFLQANNISSQLRILEDPSLHLAGVISNEECPR